jgi:hypothetical protein
MLHPSEVPHALRSSIWLAVTLVACGRNPYWIGEIVDVPDTGITGGSGGSLVSSGTGTNGGGGQGGSGGAAGSPVGSGGGGGTPDAGLTDSPVDSGSRPETGTVCQPGQCKRVFLSSSAPPSAGKLGGASAVDTFCQSAADAKQLGGTWRAWLSDGSTTPTTRFTRANVPYRLLDGTTVASSWTMLAGGFGSLAHAIDVFEDGTTASAAVEVWTGTWTDGDWWGPDCNRWTDDTAGSSANVGLSNSTARGWTSANTQLCNHTDLHVYCFEQ